ncbi:MAG: choice-of-anchor L domain-containing protein [Bacteroidetes bacterium]|nr:choice-of-anchor L domain-containing protein [Bacteroidota bacterium]
MRTTNYIVLICILFFQIFNSQQRRANKIEPSTSATLKAGAFIDVNSAGYTASSYTIEQLIKNILISGGNSNCTTPNISNVQVSPNLSASNQNRSWGYFNKALTNFPFTDGIILTTGYARRAGNTAAGGTLSDVLGTGGDPDLANAISVPNNSLNDATYIEFDFIPTVSTLTFNYIFASEEYTATYPCNFTDGFALLLKKQGDPNYTNLAILPNNAGPVSVTNIHPAINSGCSAINEQYFFGYNTANIETNFNGRTIPLTATANVIPGQSYHFKIVLADFQDSSFDSGVFLQAGSFNIGVQIGDGTGATLPPNLSVCGNVNQTLVANAQATGATYQWFLNGNPIPGATNNTYTATQAGTFSVEVTIPGSTCPGTAQIVITSTPTPVVQNATLNVCSTSTTGTFDLTTAQNSISTTPGATFSFYQNIADAQAGNNNTIANPTTYVSGNATLYVLVKNGNCSSIANLQLTLTSVSTPTITASAPKICGNGSVTLSSNLTTGNNWSTGETTQTITVTTPGTYTLTQTIGNCTSNPATITITGDADPNIQISGNSTYCASPIVLTASATGNITNYTWSNGATGATTTINAAGTYTITGTTPSGCQFIKSFVVNQGTVPTVQNTNLATCSTTNTFTFDLTTAQNQISTTPGVTFSYYQNQADAQAGNNNTIANPNTFNSGNATLFVLVKTNTCSAIAQLQLTVTEIPNTQITQSAPAICGNTPVVLTSNYAVGNIWSNGSTNQSITVTTPGTYTVTTTNGNCTGNTATVTLVATPDPNIQITGNLNFCQGSSTTLTATADGNSNIYSWSNGTNGNTTLITTPGVYTVTVTTPSGCQFQKSVTITMDPTIVLNIANPNQIDCNNTQVTLNATNSIIIPGSTILWTASGGGNIVSGNNTLTPVVNAAGTYTLTVTSPNPNGCAAQSNVVVVKNITPPVISVNASSIQICKGQTVILTAAGGVNYTWTGLTGNGNTQSVSPTTTTTYTVTGIGANGCQATNPATVTITVVPEITSTLTNGNMCKGDKLTLDAGAGPNYTYLWNTGETTQTIDVTQAGNYTVIINNGTCTKSVTAIVTYTVVPEIKEVKFDNNTLTITATNPQGTPLEYSLDNGVNWQNSNIFNSIENNMYYTISVRNQGMNCSNTVIYFTAFIPNFITPNGDGNNDTLNLSELTKYDNFGGAIYDRYGKPVFKANKNNYIWNGLYLNSPLPTATYWYELHWNDPISLKIVEKSGWILLKNRD